MNTIENTTRPYAGWLVYLLTGAFFGVLLMKSEVSSWFRIQEMFRFQSLYMYLVIGSGIVVALISVELIKRFGMRSLSGETITVEKKPAGGPRYWIGGTLFGFGWALTGACPGPLYALIGGGYSIILVPIIAAIGGAFVYGMLAKRLPH